MQRHDKTRSVATVNSRLVQQEEITLPGLESIAPETIVQVVQVHIGNCSDVDRI